MTDLAFCDTETTSLRHDRRVWEVAVIVREPWTVPHPDGTETTEMRDREWCWFIRADDLDLGNADLMSLKVGRFHERHPDFAADSLDRANAEADVLREVERLTRGAHIVGAVPNFDTEVLGNRMRAHGICPSWHYHLIDVEALAVGWLNGNATSFGHKDRPLEVAVPPWKSDDLSAALGVTVSEEGRHTAHGDARWARDLYDAVTKGAMR